MSGEYVSSRAKRQIAAEFAAWLESRNLVARPRAGVSDEQAAQAAELWAAGYRYAIRSLREMAIDPDDIPDDISELGEL